MDIFEAVYAIWPICYYTLQMSLGKMIILTDTFCSEY